MEPKIHYRGHVTDGVPEAFLNGVPARDLTEDEYRTFDAGTRYAIRESPLYDWDGFREKRDAAREAAKAEQDKPAETEKPKAAPAAEEKTVKGKSDAS